MRGGRLAAIAVVLAIAACAKSGREVILTKNAPAPIGPYSQAVRVGKALYVSGQLGVDPATGQLVQGGVVAQAHQALKNLGAIIAEAGYTFDDVVQVQVFLEDMHDFGAVNGAYRAYFTSALPARAAVEVGRLPMDAKIEVLAVASK
jgi:2-iminobutanoate/2-iminopropanoate deaminase